MNPTPLQKIVQYESYTRTTSLCDVLRAGQVMFIFIRPKMNMFTVPGGHPKESVLNVVVIIICRRGSWSDRRESNHTPVCVVTLSPGHIACAAGE